MANNKVEHVQFGDGSGSSSDPDERKLRRLDGRPLPPVSPPPPQPRKFPILPRAARRTCPLLTQLTSLVTLVTRPPLGYILPYSNNLFSLHAFQ
ncbi:hypothetical protein E2C01_043333 [Portunus trituberculatus]|uniref:Uncharacterized protein n=1 Tax=Portunus trituberculatus TaxID=210409 RepID=A0A5B7FW57_PORTR|nr:hypothetical protein [Portunus trituberculatus]